MYFLEYTYIFRNFSKIGILLFLIETPLPFFLSNYFIRLNSHCYFLNRKNVLIFSINQSRELITITKISEIMKLMNFGGSAFRAGKVSQF